MIRHDSKVSFDLKLSVTDHVFTSTARLHIQIKPKIKQRNYHSTTLTRPKFKENIFSLYVQRYSLNFSLPLDKELVTSMNDNVQFIINLDESIFQIENQTNLVYKSGLLESDINFDYYHVPVLACDRIETGLCDQMLVILNGTTSKPIVKKIVVDGAVFLYKWL